VNLHVEQVMGSVGEAALLAERESMHSAEHIAIIDRIRAKTGNKA
jgi:enoyl-CoA hydratase